MSLYAKSTLEKYLNDLAARLPAPGGGSAAAAAAGLGVSLVSMVLNFTIGKPKYAHFEVELRQLLEKSEKLRLEFLRLVDLDVAAFKSNNLRDSLNVPFMTARLCVEAIQLCPPLIKKGNINLISDVAVAVCLLEAAFFSAVVNVEINLKALNDKKLSASVRKELKRKAALVKSLRINTEEKVGQIIRG